MNALHFHVDDLTCGGCSSTVRHRMWELPGVTNVVVDPAAGTVHVEHDGSTLPAQVKDLLLQLGYPVHGTVGLAEKAKSSISCAVGRFNHE